MQALPNILTVMTPFPYSIDIAAPIADAQQCMREHGVHHLPVTKAGRLVGIVTERDIALLLGPACAYPQEKPLTVRDIYVDDAYIVDVATPLPEVLETIVARHIGSAVITKGDKLVGILTTLDACRAFSEHLHKHAPMHPAGDDAA